MESIKLGINQIVTALESDSIRNDQAVKKVARSIVSKIKEMENRGDICRNSIYIQIAKVKPNFFTTSCRNIP